MTSGASKIDVRSAGVGVNLRDRFRNLLAAIPGEPHRPQNLARALGVKKDLTSRILNAVRKEDPMAVLHYVPGPEALRRLLIASEKKGVPSDVIKLAEQAVRDFEDLVRNLAGDRGSLDAIISSWLPDARERFELLNKQAAFKAMSRLKGTATDMIISTCILYPCADGEHHNGAWIYGLLGLRRIRPGAIVKVASRKIQPPTSQSTRNLDGEPVDELQGVLLKPFSSHPVQIEVRRATNVVHYLMGWDLVGPESTIDVVTAEVSPCALNRYWMPGTRKKRGPFAEVNTPAVTLNFDVLLHEDVYPESQPTLLIFDTVLDGIVGADETTREVDQFTHSETVQLLGPGLASLRISEFPNYIDLLHHACGKLGLETERFRTYRCRIAYPIYGSQVSMDFDTPPRPV